MANKPWDIIHSKYIASAVRPEQYPQPELTEVAFIGRSNVGKSSSPIILPVPGTQSS